MKNVGVYSLVVMTSTSSGKLARANFLICLYNKYLKNFGKQFREYTAIKRNIKDYCNFMFFYWLFMFNKLYKAFFYEKFKFVRLMYL